MKKIFTVSKIQLAISACCALFVLTSCGMSGRYAVNYDDGGGRGSYHIVRPGETAYRIAKAYGVSPDLLLRVNRISDPTQMAVGIRLYIPGGHGGQSRYASATPPLSQSHGRNILLDKSAPVRPFATNAKFLWPVDGGHVTSSFGIRGLKKHDGIDISAPIGTKIYAADRGTVLFSGAGPTGYGNIVILKHDERVITVYAHCATLLVSKGDTVSKGEQVAAVGNTGRSTGPHLHFEFRVDRRPVDPLKYIPDGPASSSYASN